MRKLNIVSIFFGILTIAAIIIAIFAFSRKTTRIDYSAYEERITELTDTIKQLKKDIETYKVEIDKIDLERENIRKKLEIIINENEKIDSELTNGDWDFNIRYLSEYLSEKDSLGERHSSCDNEGTTDNHK